MDRIEECGMTEMPAMAPPMQQGTPVSMNVSLNASGTEHVEDLIKMMKNAGMGAAEPVSAKMLSPRMDMERLSSIMGEPDMGPDMESIDDEIEEGGFKDAGIELQDALHNFAEEIQKGMHSYDDVVDELNGMFDEVKASEDKVLMNAFKTLRSLEPEDFGPGEGGGPNRASSVAQDAMDMIDGGDDSDYKHLEAYANEPEPEYGDMSDAIPNGNDLNRKKGAYKVVAGGDNPMEYTMEVESIKAALLKALTEKKAKPDFLDVDKDGNKKEPMKKAVKDAGKGTGSKPKKGVVPPQFKK